MPAGTTTALVGETGSGKTTLGYLVARLYDVTRGKIAIGGADIRDLSFKALSDLVGVVSQETYLFHATVRENLRFAKPDATDAEIEAAADAARIHNVIAALPDGYDTVVGERGYRFSGGEKQRMAIARTVLRNPPILVLDEATSSLDTETERLVQDALDRLAEGRTTIAIAHRLSTVRDADQIIVLDRGRVVERGRHDELDARRRALRRRWPPATRCSPLLRSRRSPKPADASRSPRVDEPAWPFQVIGVAFAVVGLSRGSRRRPVVGRRRRSVSLELLSCSGGHFLLRRPPSHDQRVQDHARQEEARQRPQRIRLEPENPSCPKKLMVATTIANHRAQFDPDRSPSPAMARTTPQIIPSQPHVLRSNTMIWFGVIA